MALLTTNSEIKAVSRRDGPAGRLYNFSENDLVATGLLRELPCSPW
jgi:hypothetical protein